MKDALDLFIETHKTKIHVNIANVLSQLSRINFARKMEKNYHEALNQLQQALQMRESIYGQDSSHPDIIRNHQELGITYRKLKNYEKAWDHFCLQKEKIEFREETGNPEYLQCLNWLKTVAKKMETCRKCKRNKSNYK